MQYTHVTEIEQILHQEGVVGIELEATQIRGELRVGVVEMRKIGDERGIRRPVAHPYPHHLVPLDDGIGSHLRCRRNSTARIRIAHARTGFVELQAMVSTPQVAVANDPWGNAVGLIEGA